MATKATKKTAKSSSSKTTKKVAKPAAKRSTVNKTSKAKKQVSKSAPKAAKKVTLKKVDLTKLKSFATKNAKTLEVLAWVLATVVALFLVDFLVQYINNDFSAAVVNNRRITQRELTKELNDRAGEQILADMITKELVYQEAKDAGVEVTDEQVEEEFNNTAELYGGLETFETALLANGFTVDTYKDTIKFEMTLQQLIVEEPTEEELMTFFDENKDVYFTDQESYDADAQAVKDVYTQVMYQTEVTTWMQDLRDQATIQNNVTDKPSYGFFKATRNILTNIYDSVTSNTK
jgi:hypothetical protein